MLEAATSTTTPGVLVRSYDLIVVGAGSGNMLFGPELEGMRSAIIECDRFGGTCLNRGCIPSKMLVVTADAARSVRDGRRLGVDATLKGVDWLSVRNRIFGRIDPMHKASAEYRSRGGVDVYTSTARFVAPRVLEVEGERLTAEQIVVAVGSRPIQPAIPGIGSVPFYTSDDIMRVDEVPQSLLIVGGGFIAAEMGHVFGAFGADVTIVQRGPRLLMPEDEEVSAAFTAAANERFRVFVDADVVAVEPAGSGIAVSVRRRGHDDTEIIEVAALLVAVGRRPNTDVLDAAAGGLELDVHGHVVTDEFYRTSVSGVWALGDVANHFQLKHMANAEMRLVGHNLAHPGDLRGLATRPAPHAVFSEPQVASVGITEQEARASGVDHVVSKCHYGETAYGWALEDTTSFVKIIAARPTGLLLGAHIIGPHAAMLLQPLLQAMMLGQTADQVAKQVLYVHPALTEVVENALLRLAPSNG